MELPLMVSIEAISFHYHVNKDTGAFIGTCDKLGFAVEGSTLQELMDESVRLLSDLVNYLDESGNLTDYMRARGIHVSVRPVVPPSALTRLALPAAAVRPSIRLEFAEDQAAA